MADGLVLDDARDLHAADAFHEGDGCGSCCGLWLMAHGFSNEELCEPCHGDYAQRFWRDVMKGIKLQNGGISISVTPPVAGFVVPDNERFTILDLDGDKLYIRTLKQHIYHDQDDCE